MNEITAEMLTAYADGESKGEEARLVESALRINPKLREELHQYTAVKAILKREYSAVLDEPLPPRLQELLEIDGQDNASNLVHFPRRRSWLAPAAMAASLAAGVAVGLLAPWSDPGAPHHSLMASAPLAASLANIADGEHSAGLSIEASYISADGELCRAFEVTEERSNGRGLACSTDGEEWRLAALAPAAPANVYLPAGESAGDALISALTAEMTKVTNRERAEFFRDQARR